ncbi:ParM/StbA family protein [Caldanaerobacter subterraneus]|uniref:ParM/StbA family protein n=1 Tax=Caldanaerobacter subterraneus TaxID=911092 RepID=A0A7Y2PMW3_9THEO|nr:ParM/StbA family protein [Caldanaerobacter subterraneus]NNG67538.1 ParM/StbA family protein [Caldanaerobacter subterraneus]
MKIVGLDLGNSSIKVKTEKYESITPTFIAAGGNLIQFRKKYTNPDQLLNVRLVSEKNKIEGHYWVGKLAYNEAKTRLIGRNSKKPKAEDDILLITALTAIAYHLITEDPSITTEYIKLSTSLPVSEYFSTTNNYKEILKERLLGTHTVEFLDPIFNGKKVNLIVSDVQVIPEGVGAFSTFVKSEEDMKKNALLIDIGRFTTDISYFADGEFAPNGFIYVEHGTKTPIGEIQRYLLEKYDLDFSFFQIDNALRNGNKKIRAYGQEYDLTDIADTAFKNFSNLIISAIAEKIDQKSLDIKEISDVFVAGGGAVLMSNYLKFDELNKHIKVTFSENAIMANAIGNYLYAKASELELEENEESNDNSNSELVSEDKNLIELEEDIL